MHTCRCIFSLFWVLFTQTLLDSIKTQSDEGGKHLQGESKNHSPLLTTQLRLIESHSSVSAIPVFLYIYIYIYWLFFNVSFDLFIVFFFLLLKFPKSWEIRRNEKMLCWSACLPQWSSLLQSWCSMMYLCVAVLTFMSWICLCPYPPSFTFTKACPSFASVSLDLTPPPAPPCPFFHITCQNRWFITLPNSYFIHLPNTPGTVWAYTVQSLCWHNSFICNKAMQHPGKHSL